MAVNATMGPTRLSPVIKTLILLMWLVVVSGVAGAVWLRGASTSRVQGPLLVVLAAFFLLLVLVLCLSAARDRRSRPAVAALVGGILAWGAGSAALNTAEYIEVQTFPTPGETLFLLAYLGFATFLLLDVPRRTNRAAAVWLEAAVVCGGAVCLASALLLTPVAGSLNTEGLAQLLAVLYPLLDLVLAAMVLVQITVGERRWEARSVLLILGLVALAIADSSFLLYGAGGTYSTSTGLDALWGFSLALIGTAGALPRRPLAHEVRAQRTSTLAGGALVAVVVLVLRPEGDIGLYVTVPAVLTLTAAGVRMSMAIRDARGAAAAVLLSRTDELTGLANRRAVLADLSARFGGSDPLALILLDLDGFKEINDSLGHAAGDTVLTAVAERLLDTVPDATIARLGGDEFAIILATADHGLLMTLARQVHEVLLAPLQVENLEIAIRSSIGIAVAGPEDVDGPDLLRRADVAMYDAKQTRAGALVYDPARDGFSRQRLRLGEELRRGIAEGQLVVWYQPQVDARTRRVVSVEALVRWEHPKLGLLQPGTFIPGARRSGLMLALTEAVLGQAVQDAICWRKEGFEFRVSINSAPPELLGGTLLPVLYEALASSGLPPDTLVVEVTEDSFLSEPAHARQTLLELREHDVEISVDDYGTGFSSLAYLRDLPIQELKMDRSFVNTVTEDPRSRVIVESTTQMAHAMGMRLVAEGVEDEVTARALTEMGVDLLQGFHVARPMPAAAVAPWIREWVVPQQVRTSPSSSVRRR